MHFPLNPYHVGQGGSTAPPTPLQASSLLVFTTSRQRSKHNAVIVSFRNTQQALEVPNKNSSLLLVNKDQRQDI